MRKWLLCVSALCLAGLLAACGEEEAAKDPLDWAIDPGVTGEQREILRAALKIVVAECQALADIDWEAEAKKERKERNDGSFDSARFIESNPKDPFARPFIDGWTHYGDMDLRLGNDPVGWYIGFSWTDPPGIATEAWDGDSAEDVKENAKKKTICNFNEKRARKDGRVYWFKRVDALAGVVMD
jgi:hypothetical protein